LMKIYGVFSGVLLAWLGLNISTLIIFIITRNVHPAACHIRLTQWS
jgi:uncharacterized membrane protein YdjX (TVP38/TMEM64 family)